MVDSTNSNEWFSRAYKDLETAKLLYKYGGYSEIICFHCQQTMEKYLKGLLIEVSGTLHEGHNLVKLCKKAMSFHGSLVHFLKDLALVNVYYIESRYPAYEPMEVNEDDVQECLRITENLVTTIDKILSERRPE